MPSFAIFAPSDRRFRRSRTKPARRRRRGVTRWLRGAGLVGLALAGLYGSYRGATAVLNAPLFRVDRITVHGTNRLSQGEVLALLDGLRGGSILLVDLDVWQRRLLTLPWVRDAALRRVLPSSIDVVLTERTPVGLARIDSRLYLIDAQGVIIDQYGTQYAEFDVPVIDGLSPDRRDGNPIIDIERATLAARLIADMSAHEDLARRISQIDVSDLRDAVVILDEDPAMIHLGDDRFFERLRSYVELEPALHERVPEIDYVDVRFGERVYVKPAMPVGTSGSK